ncbi:outer membrane protein [Rhodoplanes azumiensis]|uniref:Outer membrane protein n=1 Tax=Rhodoplanes azumiensis TaxID=1897628 RepID=A0ABW5ALH0_9BRAD
MKKILMATVATVMSIGVAGAADLSARMPVKAPPPVMAPVFSWTGCYIGGYVGGAWSGSDSTAYPYTAGFANAYGYAYNTDSSFIGGGTVGCNWQPVGSPFVLGLEGELGYLSVEGSAYDPLRGTGYWASSKAGDWYGMITGRLGYSFGQALLYAKGGVAFVGVESTYTIPTASVSISDTVATWTVGGGLEWAFDMNWSVKAEYMYIGLDETQGACGSTTAVVGCFSQDVGGIHTAKIGLNYRFGGMGAPVMARY